MLEKQIKTLRKGIETEEIVFETVKTHLTDKREQFMEMSGTRDKQREKEIEKLDAVLKEIKDDSNVALENIEDVTTKIDANKKDNERLQAEEDYKAELEAQALADKMAMDDAARFVQNKWNWFQTVGKLLMKGKKRKGKGGKKGKKKK